jgi:pimeloyl-ACP methyl ester carboxylesterase
VPPRFRSFIIATASLTSAILTGSATSANTIRRGTADDLAPSAKVKQMAPEKKDHAINFVPCGEEIRASDVRQLGLCGAITVPENRAKPKGRTLKLPIIKIPAVTATRRAPIFVLNGGPGSSNMPGALYLKAMHTEHDVYFIGYRGADGDNILKCPEVNAAMEVHPPGTPAATPAIGAAIVSCAAQLAASGVDLEKYTIFDVVDDLEAVAAKLNVAKVNLVSVSYGTRVAQFYARQHPRRIARSVMFGANPPGHFVFSAEVNDKVIVRLAELCAKDATCSAYTTDLKRTIHLALTAGRRTGNPRINDEATRLALFNMLFSRDDTLLFLRGAVMDEMGDSAFLEQAGSLLQESTDGMIVGDLLSKGAIDVYRYEQMRPTFAMTETSIGSPWDTLYSSLAANWPRPTTPEKYLRAATDRTPTLIINGDLDVSTPLVFVQRELMPFLPNGSLVVLKDYGHTDFIRQEEAIGRMVAGFFRDGTVNQSEIATDPYVFPKP